MTAGKMLYDGYRELPAEVKEILFPEKRLVANHFFDFSPYLFAEVADSYNKQKRAGQVLRAIDREVDVGSAATSTAAEPYSSSSRSSLVVTAKQVAGYLFHKATSSNYPPNKTNHPKKVKHPRCTMHYGEYRAYLWLIYA